MSLAKPSRDVKKKTPRPSDRDPLYYYGRSTNRAEAKRKSSRWFRLLIAILSGRLFDWISRDLGVACRPQSEGHWHNPDLFSILTGPLPDFFLYFYFFFLA